MTFLNPILAGVGLACVALPVLIHILMRRRRKPVMWAAMKFLLEAYRQHRNRVRLEQFLLLASRCLLVALLALALGRPMLSGTLGVSSRGAITLYIVIDDSLAASALDESGKPALVRHKAAAAALLSQLDAAAGDRAAVIALGGPARAIVSPPATDAGAVASVINDLETVDSAADTQGAFAIVGSGLASKDGLHGRAVVAVLSDFLTGSADVEKKLESINAEHPIAVLASTPAAAGAANISMTSVEPERPVLVSRAGGVSQVRVGLHRSGAGVSEAAVTTVRLTVQADSATGKPTSTPAGQFPVRWQPGQTSAVGVGPADLVAAAKTAGATGAAVLSATIDNDAIAGDNTWRRPIEIARTLRVGLVSPRRIGGARPGVQQFEPADWIRLSLEPTEGGRSDGDAEVIEIEPLTLDGPRLAGLDAAVIPRPDTLPEGSWKRLRTFADQGGFVLVFPAPGLAVPLWADAMARDMGLPWTIAREPRAWPEGAPISPQVFLGTPGGATGLLSVLAPELAEIAPPVRLFRALKIENYGSSLLSTADGAPIIVAASPATGPGAGGAVGASPRGVLALVTAALHFDWTNLQAKPLMVPLMWELIKQGVGAARGSWSVLAGNVPAAPPRSVELRGPSGSIRVTPGGQAQSPLRQAAVWRALDEQGALRGLVAVNADARAGRTDPQPASAIASWLGAATGQSVRWLDPKETLAGRDTVAGALARSGDSMRWVMPLLIAALGVALLELAIARWFSHAGLPRSGGPAA